MYNRCAIACMLRGGSQYAGRVFEALGLGFGWERVLRCEHRGGPPRWNHVKVAASGYASPFIRHLQDDVFIVHQVRDPRHCLGNWIDLGWLGDTWKERDAGLFVDTVGEEIPELFDFSSHASRLAYFWIKWNRMIEEAKDRPGFIRIQVEKYTRQFLRTVCDALGHEVREEQLDSAMSVPRTTNSFRRSNQHPKTTGALFDVDTIPDMAIRDEFVALARDYGYDVCLRKTPSLSGA